MGSVKLSFAACKTLRSNLVEPLAICTAVSLWKNTVNTQTDESNTLFYAVANNE